MARTRIALDSELLARASQQARATGVSLNNYIEKLLARELAEAGHEPDITRIFDLGSSSGSNIALNKDAMVGEAVIAAHKRSRRLM